MYRTADQINSAIGILSSWFPDFFSQQQLPELSAQGKPVYTLLLRAGGGASRRGVLVVGGTHSRELMNPDAIVDLAIDLFLSYANGTAIVYGNRTWSADDIKVILESLDIWLVPCMNPDGRDYVMTTDDLWRKSRGPIPGNSCIGTDLNRNADIVWGVAQGQTSCSPCSDIYCGPGAFSEPETRNIKHLLDSARMVSFVDVHSYSELVLYPWGHAPTQSSDPSKQFTGLATGTCTASVPSGYAEYMPAVDVQRFTTVARTIVNDIAAVRGRRYTAEASFTLYPTTGTQGEYAYSRHLKDPNLYKTYGFSFETGPLADTTPNSFHPADPSLIQRDAKAGILSLLQESVCAIELIGVDLFSGASSAMAALRDVRDRFLATTAAGREWIALFERVQFPLLRKVLRSPKLANAATELLSVTAKLMDSKNAPLKSVDADRMRDFVESLYSSLKDRALRADLLATLRQIDQLSGWTMPQVISWLMKRGPGLKRKVVAKKRPRRVSAKSSRRQRPPRRK